MALIKCPECGKEISDKSDVCIHCGYPIKTKIINKEKNCVVLERYPVSNLIYLFIFLICFVFFIVILIITLVFLYKILQ